MSETTVQCPECGSNQLYKDGLRCVGTGRTVQRWLCRACSRRFSESYVQVHIRGQNLKRPEPRNGLAHYVVSRLDFSGKKPVDNFPFSLRENVASHACPNAGQDLNKLRPYNRTHQVCDSLKEASKNLNQETEIKTVPGDIQQTQQDLKGKLVQYSFYMEKQGYAPETIRTNNGSLRALEQRNANLLDPESVKETLAKEKT